MSDTGSLNAGFVEAVKGAVKALEQWNVGTAEGSIEVVVMHSDHPVLVAVIKLQEYYWNNKLPMSMRRYWRVFLGSTRVIPVTRDTIQAAYEARAELLVRLLDAAQQGVPDQGWRRYLDDREVR